MSTTLPLRLDHVGRRFGKPWVLRDINLDLHEGEILGFLGANGAGKTTTIRLILGLLPISEGHITLLGRSVPAGVETMRHVGSLSETPAFYGWLSARDNLRAILGPIGIEDSSVDDSIEKVGLSAVSRQRVRTFSLGMRTRLGIARAICGAPRVVVLDEPTNGLDPPWIREFRTILGDLRESGTSVLLSSHQLTEVERSCDRVAFLESGRLMKQGPMDEFLKPAGWLTLAVSPHDVERVIPILHRFEYERLDDRRFKVWASGSEVGKALQAADIVPEAVIPGTVSLEEILFGTQAD